MIVECSFVDNDDDPFDCGLDNLYDAYLQCLNYDIRTLYVWILMKSGCLFELYLTIFIDYSPLFIMYIFVIKDD